MGLGVGEFSLGVFGAHLSVASSRLWPFVNPHFGWLAFIIRQGKVRSMFPKPFDKGLFGRFALECGFVPGCLPRQYSCCKFGRIPR